MAAGEESDGVGAPTMDIARVPCEFDGLADCREAGGCWEERGAKAQILNQQTRHRIHLKPRPPDRSTRTLPHSDFALRISSFRARVFPSNKQLTFISPITFTIVLERSRNQSTVNRIAMYFTG